MRNLSLRVRPARFVVWFMACLAIWSLPESQAQAAIEAVKGKKYKLTEKHGPWMIAVTSLGGENAELGQVAATAAQDLVYQLRQKGIPAYTFEQPDELEEIETYNRAGRLRKVRYKRQKGMIGVLAGNYPSADSKVARDTLKFIKNFKPKVNVEINGAPVEVPLDLHQAILTKNPALPAGELAKKDRDPLVLQLNSGTENSLLENRGRYTLVVASFYGATHVKPAEFERFERSLTKRSNINLDKAADEAWQLCRAMRQQKQLDAYVYHDRFRSIVTVGAFNSPNDPKIAELTEMFRAKYRPDPNNPKSGEQVLISESFQLPGKKKGERPARVWVMDPNPELMEVPKW